jgi:hypothetical protein
VLFVYERGRPARICPEAFLVPRRSDVEDTRCDGRRRSSAPVQQRTRCILQQTDVSGALSGANLRGAPRVTKGTGAISYLCCQRQEVCKAGIHALASQRSMHGPSVTTLSALDAQSVRSSSINSRSIKFAIHNDRHSAAHRRTVKHRRSGGTALNCRWRVHGQASATGTQRWPICLVWKVVVLFGNLLTTSQTRH